MTDRPVLLLMGKHRPHEQLLLAYGALSGSVFLVGSARPAGITAIMPGAVVTAWAVGLVVSGVVGLIGCWWRGERGLVLEAGGLLVGAGALLLYAATALAVGGTRAMFPAGVVLAWLAANLWRVWQVRGELRSTAEARAGS